MVEVFTTNLTDSTEAEKLIVLLNRRFNELKINFDLEKDSTHNYPCSHNILRVEGPTIQPNKIINLMNKEGFKCDILEDTICK